MKKGIFKKIYPIFLLTIVVFISVSLLVVINNITLQRVKAQQEAEIVNLLVKIFPKMSDYEYKNEIYFIYEDDKEIGYAFLAVGKGYGGEIDILVGLDEDFTVKEVTIISHTETPGLGGKITEASFRDQFKGLSVDDIALRKDGGKVDAITGATISSKAVVEAVRNKMIEKINAIEGKK